MHGAFTSSNVEGDPFSSAQGPLEDFSVDSDDEEVSWVLFSWLGVNYVFYLTTSKSPEIVRQCDDSINSIRMPYFINTLILYTVSLILLYTFEILGTRQQECRLDIGFSIIDFHNGEPSDSNSG